MSPWRTAAALGAAAVLPIAALLALVSAAPPDPGKERDKFYGQKIDWRPCGKRLAKEAEDEGFTPPEYVHRLECGSIDIPKIYAVPERGKLTMEMIRLPATGDGEGRHPSLVMNFGGPGESGVTGLAGLAGKFKTLNTRYDLVAHDPRGVARTAPVHCGEPTDEDLEKLDYTPDNASEAEELYQADQVLNEVCGRNAGDIIPWVGTVDATRDLEVLRTALGEKKLDYFGFSYGTKLGANYLHKYPDKAGRFVLDGVMNVTLDGKESALADTRAFKLALDSFVEDCTKRSDCPLDGDPKEAAGELRELFTDLDSVTLSTDAGDLDQDVFVQAITNSLYSKGDGWPALREGLAELGEGDGSLLVRLGGGGGGSAVTPPSMRYDAGESNENEANRAITCRDTSDRYTPEDYVKAQAEFTKISPIFGKAMAGQLLACSGWPVLGENTANRVAAEDAPPALLVSTSKDPATPYAGAAATAKVLNNDSVVVTHVGDGHTAYVTGDTCIDELVDGYLLKGRMPSRGDSCG